VRKQMRTWHVDCLLLGGIALLVATMCLPRSAQAVVSIECEILISGGDVLQLADDPLAVVGINLEEDGAGEAGAPPPDRQFPGFSFTPSIYYIDPISGTAAGGDEVTIYGWNFTAGSTVTFSDGINTVAIVPTAVTLPPDDDGDGIPDDPSIVNEILIVTPAWIWGVLEGDYVGGFVDVTVHNNIVSTSATEPNGFFYILPSPYPGLEGSSTLSWVEVILSTDALDDFSSTSSGQDLIDDFRDYLDKLFTRVTIWVDGTLTTEGQQGEFNYQASPGPSDDRQLIPLIVANIDGSDDISDAENNLAEVYENPLPGSRGRVVSFARNRELGQMLRTEILYTEPPFPFDPPVTLSDMVGPYRDPETEEMLDQIMYRFLFKWPAHDTNPFDGDGDYNEFVGFVSLFEVEGMPLQATFFVVPGLGTPQTSPVSFISDIIEHESNQYIGPPGGGEGENPLFEGNDYFVTVEAGSSWSPSEQSLLNVRVLPGSPAIPIPPPGVPAHPPGIDTDPMPGDPFEGCDVDASLVVGSNIPVFVDPVPRRSNPIGVFPENVQTRIRPDKTDINILEYARTPCLPRIVAMDDHTPVLAIGAHGGNPPDFPIFIDRVTVTLTDVGGGLQFGRKAADTFPGDGGFNPWSGLDPFGLFDTTLDEPGEGQEEEERGGLTSWWDGVSLWKDFNNSGDFEPDGDICLTMEWYVVAWNPDDPFNSPMLSMETGYEPYVYIQDPGKGVPGPGGRAPRDDPEWTVVLMKPFGQRSYRQADGSRVVMTGDNVADFALEAVPENDPAEMNNPDFFIVVRADSGYFTATTVGDGTAIEYGADFRAYIKPELLEDPNDPLNVLARQTAQQAANDGWIPQENAADYRFPGGIVFSHNPRPWLATTMEEWWSTAYAAVLETHDYVTTFDSDNPFTTWGMWEIVPFFLWSDTLQNSGPRSPFYYAENPPGNPLLPHQFPGPLAEAPPFAPVSDFWYYAQDAQAAALTLYEERSFFEGKYGHRIFPQRIDNLSPPTAVLGLNTVGASDPLFGGAWHDLNIAQIQCFLVSEDRPHGPTGFEPSDLLPFTEDGLGNTGISLWRDNVGEGGSSGYFNRFDDTQLPLIMLTIGDTPMPIDMDGIDQDRGPDMWGYPVTIRPVSAFDVPLNDIGENEADDLFIVVQTSDTIGYNDRVEVVIPAGGVTFHPTGKSTPSGTVRHDIEFYGGPIVWYVPGGAVPRLGNWQLPIEDGDTPVPFLGPLWDDQTRLFATSQLIVNVPTELNSLVLLEGTTRDTDGDLQADTREIGWNSDPIPVIGIDVATLKPEAEVYLEYLVVEFYNQGVDENDDQIPDDADFSPEIDLLPFSTSDEVVVESFASPEHLGPVEVLQWHVSERTHVNAGEPLVDLETEELDITTGDPIVETISAPFTGTVATIEAAVGAAVQPNDTLALIAHIGSGISLYRDSDTDGTGGVFDPPTLAYDENGNPFFEYVDLPVELDDPPDIIGVSGQPPIQVRMAFSSPGTDDWAGETDLPTDNPQRPYQIDLAEQTQQWQAREDAGRPWGRQRVPTTFGRDPNGQFVTGHADAGNDFFVVIRTSGDIAQEDDFSVGIVSWGYDTPTGVDPDTFTAPPQPLQPSDEYRKFDEHPWGSRGLGFIELLPPRALYQNPDTPGEDFYPEFDFLRTRSTAQMETEVLLATTGVEPSEPTEPTEPGEPGEPGGTPTPPYEIGGGGGGGCFIATAAFGSPQDEHVAALIAFRDRYLLTNAGGTWLVRQYYTISPRLADIVAKHDGVRAVVRQAIRPLALVAGLCITTSVTGKIAATLAVALLAIGLARIRRVWRFVRVKNRR